MTPLQITMMLHYHALAQPYALHEPQHARSPAVFEQRSSLIRDEMLALDPDSMSGYRVTERGRAYVEALCALPLPIKKWIMPAAA